MKNRRHTPEQVIRKLAEGGGLLARGKTVEEVARHLEISEQTFHRWRNQYGGMKADDAQELRELRKENAQLKKLLAEAGLDEAMLKELAEETSDPEPAQGGGDAARSWLRGLRTPRLSSGRPGTFHPAACAAGSARRRARPPSVPARPLAPVSALGLETGGHRGTPGRLGRQLQADLRGTR